MSNLGDENIASLNSLVPAMVARGFNLGTELEAIKAATLAGNFGITATAAEIDAAAKGARHFARRTDADSGLTFGYGAGVLLDGQTRVSVAQGTILLSASTTNYVELTYSGGTWSVTTNTSGFTAGGIPLYTIVTASASITTVTPAQTLLRALRTGGITGAMLSQAMKTTSVTLALGTVSATKAINIPLPPFAGTLARASLVVTTTVAANDTNYWTAGLVNKGAAGAGSTVMVDASAAANSTKVTGGSAATAFVQRALTLSGTPANLDVSASGDVLVLTLTKTASAADLVDLSVKLDFESVA
jgi:hypothetical protein